MIVPGGPPLLRDGMLPIVAVSEDKTVGHLLALTLPGSSAEGMIEFAPECAAHWNAAAAALPRSLPVLWKSVEQVRAQRPGAVFLDAMATQPGAWETPPVTLKGASFGLAFLLAMTSRVLGQPLPADVIGSATIDANGAVGPVEGLEAKIAVISERAPRVRRLLVAEAQREDAERLACRLAPRLEVIAIRNAGGAVQAVFGDAFERYIVDHGRDLRERGDLVASFFGLAIKDGRSAVVDWTPVENGARSALAAWRDLGRGERWKLDMAYAIAARHERNARVEWSLPGADELRELPPPVRVAVVAHLFQSWADTGFPGRGEVEFLARETGCYVEPEASFPPHLRMWGAYARGLAVTGGPREALAIQQKVARALVAQLEYDEVSYSLSEWYRLTGAVGDRDAFERAEAMRAELRGFWSLSPDSEVYVDLAWARASITLSGSAEREKVVARLSRIVDDRTLAVSTRWSAARVLESARSASPPAPEEGGAPALPSAETASERERSTVETYQALCDLDRALAAGDAGEACLVVERLQAVEPGPVGHLRAAAEAAGEDVAAYVACFYPY